MVVDAGIPLDELRITDLQNSRLGGSDGAINISVTGGTPGYSYDWAGLPSTQDVSNLVAGDFRILVRDTNNCIFVDTITVNEPAQLVASAVDNGNGTATASSTTFTCPLAQGLQCGGRGASTC